jgi:hypothetical protein
MKKTVLTLLFISMTWFSLLAQVKIGVRVGAAFTDVNMNVSSEFDNFEVPASREFNYSAGITAEFPLMEDLLSLRSTLEFAQNGYKVNLDELKKKYNDIKELQGDWYTRYQYLKLPVDLVYKLGDFNINAGPYLGYGLGGKEFMNIQGELNDGNSFDFNEVYDLKPVFGDAPGTPDDNGNSMLIHYFNSLDFGFNVGFGYTIKNVQLNVQYQQGLTNITPAFEGDSSFDPSKLDMRHNVVSLQLTYFFNFGKK